MPGLIRGLMLAQALALSAAPLLVFSGGIVGSQLNPDPRLATLPVAALISGTALAAWPVARLAVLIGRRSLFLLAMLAGAVFSAGAGYAIYAGSFWLFTLFALGFGAVNAIVQQFRFVAIASVPADQSAVVAARLLLAGLLSAFLGPELVRLIDWYPQAGFAAAYSGLVVLYLLAAAVLFRVMPVQSAETSARHDSGRSWTELLRQPALPLAMASAACGYGVMAYVMTATPLSMTQGMGYELEDAKWVIQSHIAAMYLPSLISGHLIRFAGHWKMVFAGLLVMLLCLLVAWWDQQLIHYWGGLVLLGLGWNLLFVAGTSMLAGCYRPEEAGRVQGMNDMLVFTAQAFGALASGAVVLLLGWQGLLLTTLPALVLLLIILLRTPRAGL